MSTATSDNLEGQTIPPTSISSGTMGDRLREFLKPILTDLSQRWHARERRRHPRKPFPALMRLTPLDPVSLQPNGDPIVVVGKDLSEQGVGFFHAEPLPFRKAAVELNVLQSSGPVLLLDLTWCRSTRIGWYENGGRFIDVLGEGTSVDGPQ